MGKRGGAMPGAGRKKKVDEEWARNICIKAVTEKYGSVEAGINAVLDGRDESVKKLIWTHILGAAETTTKVKLSDNKGGKLQGLGGNKIIVEVVRTVHNKDTGEDGNPTNENNDSSRLPEQEF